MSERRRAWSTSDALLLIAGALVALFGFAAQIRHAASLPFLSEDWTQLAEMSRVPTFLGALDPHLEPLRPFQHAYFWIFAHVFEGRLTETDVVALAHGLALALHAASCFLVYRLAREMGLGVRGALAAAWLFAVFPNVKSVAWPAAIGSPGRVTFELLALVCFVRHVKTKTSTSAICGIVAFLLALGFHESAMLVPVFVVLWIACSADGGARGGIARVVDALRSPWFASLAVVTTLYVVHLAFLRPERHHQLKSLAALPANGVKAVLSLAPEFLRATAVDGLRTASGSASFVLGAALVITVLAFAVYVATRSGIARFIVAAIVVELALPTIGAGFAQRYAYLAAAFLAIGVARWCESAWHVVRPAIAISLGVCWAFDSYRDRVEVREAGQSAQRLVAIAREGRRINGPDVPIAIVDPPDMAGAEGDIPLFNWGVDYMLAAHDVAGPWLYWRTRAFRTTTNFELVDEARVETAKRAGTPRLIFIAPNAN